jgi:hypothetical protein
MKQIMSILVFVFSLDIFLQKGVIYAQDNSIYLPSVIRPDINDVGLTLLKETTGLLDNINIIESGWVDIIGDKRYTEYYANYITGSEERNIIIISSRWEMGILYHINWKIGNNIYDVDFFERNNKSYVMVYYKGGSGGFFGFAIFEFVRKSMFNKFRCIFESGTQDHGGYTFIDNKLIIKGGGDEYILTFRNEKYELIKVLDD